MPAHRLFRLRSPWLVRLALPAVALLVVLRLGTLQGLFVPVRIAGRSMAETLLGPHHEITCRGCGIRFRCAIADPRATTDVICANCGHTGNQVEPLDLHAGDRVLVDRLAFTWRSPRRWEVVAFRDPQEPGMFAAKRVVGLPGEQIRIERGELYADGQLVRKPLAVLRQLAVLVHDDRFRGAGSADAPRWRPDDESSGWVPGPESYRWTPAEDRRRSVDWLTYHHVNYFAGPQGGQQRPILDLDPYNLGNSRQLHEVRDLMLRLRVQAAPAGQVSLVAHDGRDRFRLELGPGGAARLWREQQLLGEKSFPMTSERAVTLEFALCDQQVLIAADGRLVWHLDYEDRQIPFQPTTRPLAVGAAGGEINVSQLQVCRDIYYLPAYDFHAGWQTPKPLGSDQVLLLGDNCAVSLDSRYWSPPGLPEQAILGRIVEF